MIFQQYAVTAETYLMQDQKSRKYDTLTDFIRDKGAVITYPIGRVLARMGIHPNMVTLAGFVLNIITGVILSTGQFLLGGVMVIVASAVDGFDGALARVSNQKTSFGAFWDSTLDRISEGALFFGLLVWFVSHDMLLETYLVYFVVLGSIMVSYARARAEGLGFECKVGLLTRLERMSILSLGLILGWMRLTLIIMLVMTWVTFIQRMVVVYRVSSKEIN
jgi:CDP-diacylglycerol--glycerol-3-phosphate 3-phosphatidyltransferase